MPTRAKPKPKPKADNGKVVLSTEHRIALYKHAMKKKHVEAQVQAMTSEIMAEEVELMGAIFDEYGIDITRYAFNPETGECTKGQ